MIERYLPTDSDWKDQFIVRWVGIYIAFVLVMTVLFFYVLSQGGDIGFWQQAVSWIIFASVMFFLVVANLYYKQDGADEYGRRHLQAIKPQLINASPPSVTLERGVSLSSYRDAVDALFDGNRSEQTTVRGSIAEFRAAWAEQTRRFPTLAVAIVYEAALILVFGAIVLLPVSWWSGSEAAGLSVSVPPVGSWVWAAVTALPGVEMLFSLGLVLVLVVGEILFEQFLVLAAVLAVGAYLIVRLDRETSEDLSVTLYPDRRVVAGSLAAVVGLVYLAGAVPTLLGGWLFGLIGLEFVGPILGLVAILFVVATIGRDAAADLRARLVLQQTRPDENTALVAAYLLVRKAWALLGLLCLPLLVVYVGVAIGTGQLFAVALELAGAGNHIRLPALLILLLSGLLVKHQYPELTAELTDAVRRATSSSMVRGVMFARGVPLLAVVVGFAASWPLFGAQVALVVGLAAGAITRLATLAWTATKYRFVDLADRDRGHPRVIVSGFTVEDADGRDVYVASVDGENLAHRDRDALVDIVLQVARERLENGRIPPTFAAYYYDEATDYGRVHIDEVGDEYRADIKTRIEATLREHDGELEAEKMDSEMCEEYAEAAYWAALRWLKRHGDVDRRRGKYVLH